MHTGPMPTCDPPITSGRQPEGWNPWHTPLPAVTVATHNQINSMVRLHLIQHIRGMGQQQRKAMVRARWETAQVSPVERGVIDSDDHQLSPTHWDNGALIHQQCDLVPIGEFGILCH